MVTSNLAENATTKEKDLQLSVTDQKHDVELQEKKVDMAGNGKKKSSADDKDSLSEDELLFKDMTLAQKATSVVVVLVKLLSMLACLYVFICSLGLLESAFQLLGGKTAGQAFSSGVLSNPLAGLMIGVLATVLVQSSSTTTSIIVTMVGSNIIPVEKAVPIVMGANIGTSITNTLVSLAQISNRQEFRRAFSGATVHDMFNWLSVIVLLPIEIASGYLTWLSGLMVKNIQGGKDKAPDMLKAITKPVLDHIVEINSNIISDVAASANASDGDVLKRWCSSVEVQINETTNHNSAFSVNCDQLLHDPAVGQLCDQVRLDTGAHSQNVTFSVQWSSVQLKNVTKNQERCDNLFALSDLSDAAAGAIILICSLILLLMALFLIVKILNSLLSGSVNKVIKKTINSDLPGPFAYFTGYLALLVGCGMTMIVQSSSVFTSTLTPLVGLGIVSVERMYPMTLGSNVGTTITAILAALSQDHEHVKLGLQIALCHLFFNISGILLFYPIPFMRWPVGMAKLLGKTTSKYRWFAIAYIIIMFIILPIGVFGLSVAGWIYLGAIGGPIAFIALIVVIVNALQKKKPNFLPKILRNWNYLPLWCHSLRPLDKLIGKAFKCKYCQKLQKASKDDEENITIDNETIDKEDEESINEFKPTPEDNTMYCIIETNKIKGNDKSAIEINDFNRNVTSSPSDDFEHPVENDGMSENNGVANNGFILETRF